MKLNRYFFFFIMFITAQTSFSDSQIFAPAELESESYICVYKEKYYDGIGESVLEINKSGNGFYIVWHGITDRTEVYTDSDFNTLRMRMTDPDTDLEVFRKRDMLNVIGIDKGKTIIDSLELKSDNWFQLLPVSFIPFIKSSDNKISFTMFNPYNIGTVNLEAEKIDITSINFHEKEIPVQKLCIRLKGFLSLFWKSEIWCSTESGLQVKYEGLNVVPRFYNAVIELQNISLNDPE